MRAFITFFEGIYESVKVWIMTTQWFMVAKIAVCATVATTTVFYGAAMLYKEESAFTVGIEPVIRGEEKILISLSETADFEKPVTNLSVDGIDRMTNISVNWLPEDLDTYDGAHNGEHYIAYTFYLKNSGDTACFVTEVLELESAVKNADDAVRVRLYKNGEMTTYAKMGANGLPEKDHGIETIPFSQDSVVFTHVNENMQPGDIIKYTLVIWLEGDDPECLDNIRGGRVKMSMTFSTSPAEGR